MLFVKIVSKNLPFLLPSFAKNQNNFSTYSHSPYTILCFLLSLISLPRQMLIIDFCYFISNLLYFFICFTHSPNLFLNISGNFFFDLNCAFYICYTRSAASADARPFKSVLM